MTRAQAVVGVAVALLLSIGTAAQVPEFDFYPDFRRWLFTLPDDQRRPLPAMLERYRQRLRDENTSATEIERRLALIETKRPELEADFWNRFFTIDAPKFNTAPNAFLVSVTKGRTPGRALDVGMGEGRNSLYLASQGWDVTGFDPADRAVALAQERARTLGLTLRTSVSHDRDFAFGSAQWDLIVLSYMPANDPPRLIEALRPGGILIFEGPRAWFPHNGALKAFDALRVLRYEDEVRLDGDFFQGERTPMIRLLAEKPAS